MLKPEIGVPEARRIFNDAVAELVELEWLRWQIDAVFGVRVGSLTRAQVKAMLRDEFPELSLEVRDEIEREFFGLHRAVDRARALFASIEAGRAEALSSAVRRASRAWQPNTETSHER